MIGYPEYIKDPKKLDEKYKGVSENYFIETVLLGPCRYEYRLSSKTAPKFAFISLNSNFSFPFLLYTKTLKFPTLFYTSGLKKVPLSGGAPSGSNTPLPPGFHP